MSVNMNNPDDSNKIIPFIERSIQSQRDQLESFQLMVNEMKQIKSEVQEKAREIAEIKTDVQLLAKEIKDENRLLPAEIDDLFNAVVKRSIEVAKANKSEQDEEFTKLVGRIRRKIWSEMKKRFGTSKYIHIRRKDFKSALSFVDTFNLGDYV